MTKLETDEDPDLEALPVGNDTRIKIRTSRPHNRTTNCRCLNFIPKRFIFSFIGFLASTLAISLNTNLSMAIVSMVDRSNESIIHVKSSNECLSQEIETLQLKSEVKETERRGEFHWSPEIEGLALGAVYYGQLVGFMPGGRMAELYGGKRTLLIFLALASACTILIPLAAKLSVFAFVACRFLIGVGTAPVIPVLFYLISRWIPDSERSFNASFILAGYGVGAFLSFLTAGMFCASDFLGGWPAVFYVGGLCGFAWCLLCYLLIYETPRDHPTITARELDYISKHLGPTDQKKNGEMSCLPPLTRGLFACLCGYPADWLVKKGYVSVGFIRKGATLINSIFSCMGFIAILLAGCDPLLNTVFFTVGGLLGDFITFGVCMAGIDIAPNLTGTVSGILSIVGVIPFFVIPALVGWSTKYERSMAQWRYVYYSTIGVVVLTTAIYLAFGTSDPQPWGTDDEENESEDNLEATEPMKPE